MANTPTGQSDRTQTGRSKPVVLFVGTGMAYVSYIIWSVRSLQRFGYEPIEVVVGNQRERRYVKKKLPDVNCGAVKVRKQGYHIWIWKVFVLDKYRLRNQGRDVVVSDGDILWLKDPSSLFDRFAGQFWFHKLHHHENPAELERPAKEIPRDVSNWLDLSSFAYYSFAYYWERYGFLKPQTEMVSSGLFMVPADRYQHLVARWVTACQGLPPAQTRRNQVILSIVANEMGLEPVCDHEAGYAVAKHYSSRDQKPLMVQDAQELGLDFDGLGRRVHFPELIQKGEAKLRRFPRGLYRRTRKALRMSYPGRS